MLGTSEQQSLITRLNRIEGQIRGIRRMVQEPRLCVEILQQLASGLGLLDGVGSQGEADGVTYPLIEQRGYPRNRLDETGRRGASLGHAEVQRVVDGVGKKAVGIDHRRHAGVLHRDLDVGEVDLLEIGDLL